MRKNRNLIQKKSIKSQIIDLLYRYNKIHVNNRSS
jgi:hypothetical protein